MISTPTHQALLAEKLEILFPKDRIHVNIKKETNIKHPETGGYLELDVWIPSLNLSFEFQDTYHYMTTWYSQHTLDHVKKNDGLKDEFTRSRGKSLIIVPSWWDGTVESLAASIIFQRPDLIVSLSGFPIPLNPPISYNTIYKLPDAGELMRASFPSADFMESISRDWWIGEKYDGIRLYWHPINSQAYTRNGNSIPLLPSMEASFPKLFIDGEFWFGRGQFINTYMLFKNVNLVSWDYIRVLSFDMPLIQFQNQPFETRYEILVHGISVNHPHTIIATRVQYISILHLKGMLGYILADGGEGIVLRKKQSAYSQGRALTLLKLKTHYRDAEGLVIKSDLDSIHLELPDGKKIVVPSRDVHTPIPREGSVVTFAYEIHPRTEIPINPVVLRARTDISWEDVIASFYNEKGIQKIQPRSRVNGYQSNSVQSPWTKLINRRKFFEDYANKRIFDPLIAHNWYPISKEEILQYKGARRVLSYHKDSLTMALLDLFPEVKFDKFRLRASWHDMETRLSFFKKYAEVNAFDPFVPQNWYTQLEGILATKGSYHLFMYYSSIQEALLDVFPNIGLVISEFKENNSLPERPVELLSYSNKEEQKKCFERFAMINKFDPSSEAWYFQSKAKIMSYKDLSIIINLHYHGSRSYALKTLFPNLGLKAALFNDRVRWSDPTLQRSVFESFARANGFDPQVPDNWYSHSKRKIRTYEGVSSVIRHYQGSVSKALQTLFPEGFEPEKLKIQPFNPHASRLLLETYAKEHGFDPLQLQSWLSQPKRNLLKYKGLTKVLLHYNGNLERVVQTILT